MTYIAPKSYKNQGIYVELKHLIAKSTMLSYSLHTFHCNILLLPHSLCSLYLANSILLPGLLTMLCVSIKLRQYAADMLLLSTKTRSSVDRESTKLAL